MNVDITTNIISNSYIKFTLWRSPINNNIIFIKNKTLNVISKRKYATAEIYLNNKIPESIQYFFVKHNIDISKVAYISYIETIKTRINTCKNESSSKSFTLLNKKNINKTYKNTKYYNKRNKYYILSKGYGKILINNIEKILKDKGIKYISLIPSKHSLIKYYTNLNYKLNKLNDIIINDINEQNAMRYNTEYISPNVFMYKQI
jgi:hypothetical protein